MSEGYWLDLGFIAYAPAFALQEQALEARMAARLPATIIVQENPPTFTMGRAGSASSVLLSRAELADRGIDLIEASRGGDVTYHGPGQLVASPLLFLGDVGLNAVQYMHRLEGVLLEVLAAFGLAGRARADYPGAWLGDAKVGAVGIGVRHGYTFHGLSLNVNLDLGPFQLINPCGVPAMPVTSMQVALGRPIALDEVRSALRRALSATFDLKLKDVTADELWQNLTQTQATGGS
jgi:lipoate-protein ligase B